MGLSEDYYKAMQRGDLNACLRIERSTGLYGYPPELVSVGLIAIDDGRDGFLAVDDYINADPDDTAPTE